MLCCSSVSIAWCTSSSSHTHTHTHIRFPLSSGANSPSLIVLRLHRFFLLYSLFVYLLINYNLVSFCSFCLLSTSSFALFAFCVRPATCVLTFCNQKQQTTHTHTCLLATTGRVAAKSCELIFSLSSRLSHPFIFFSLCRSTRQSNQHFVTGLPEFGATFFVRPHHRPPTPASFARRLSIQVQPF